MFLAVTKDSGGVQPWEYLTAGAGVYQVGQLLKLYGELGCYDDNPITVTPQYLCMAKEDIPEGEFKAIPVVRITGDTVFETVCETDGLMPGNRYAVFGSGGVRKDTEGAFEITDVLDGAVRGRFVAVGQAAAVAVNEEA